MLGANVEMPRRLASGSDRFPRPQATSRTGHRRTISRARAARPHRIDRSIVLPSFQVGEIGAAAPCLNTVISNNEKLLDQYVDDSTVSKFIELIGVQGPHKRFMEFFKASSDTRCFFASASSARIEGGGGIGHISACRGGLVIFTPDSR